MADDNPTLTDAPSDNGANTSKTAGTAEKWLAPITVTGSHFRTLFLRCNYSELSEVIHTLIADRGGWDGWETSSGLHVAWRYQSSTVTPRLNLEVLNDPAYPYQYTLGTFDAVDLTGDIWAMTFTQYKFALLHTNESQVDLDRQKLRQTLFEEQSRGAIAQLCEGQSLDWVTPGITRLKGFRPVTVIG